jgi:hypothetical protein
LRASLFVAAGAGVIVLSAAGIARANPVPLPFTYTYETLPSGEGEVEQYVDYTPVKATGFASNGNPTPVTYAATQFQTEFEYGITDHLELGLYVTYEPTPSGALTNTPVLTEGTGLKQRLRYRILDEGKLPVDLAVYGEIVEFETEFEIEAKVLLQKRFGNLKVDVNLWAEREFYYELNQHDWVLNPTAGATYQIAPVFNLGVEYWMRAEFPDPAPHPRPFNVGPHHYVGPALMFNFGKLWWTTGVYARVDDTSRTLQPGDAYGEIWVRSIVGFGL